MTQQGTEDWIWPKIHELAEACQGESNSFEVVAPFEKVDAAKPLYVLVHPGDVVQTKSDVRGSPDAGKILGYSVECQEGMADDIELLMKAGWDVAILHRFSSSYGFGTSGTVPWFEDAVDEIHVEGAVLFGDKLDRAAAWLLQEASAAQRPAVMLSGAWSEFAHGCVSAVGEFLEAGGAKVILAASACISPDGSGNEWKAAAGKLTSSEAAKQFAQPTTTPAVHC